MPYRFFDSFDLCLCEEPEFRILGLQFVVTNWVDRFQSYEPLFYALPIFQFIRSMFVPKTLVSTFRAFICCHMKSHFLPSFRMLGLSIDLTVIVV